ncbi:transcription repressor OFP13-like [Vicia villosa]|uniref:transcription repressor OFP13-like n=1 Tax=Vicia villosa TaxID=3911 RepID=UPI00273C998B|nr:transcription repressor OFP13-like [Vicia villosa]
MVKKMKLLSFFKTKGKKSSSPRACLQCSYKPKTLSFREDNPETSEPITPEFSSEDFRSNSVETVNIDDLRSDRFFFESDETRSIFKTKENITRSSSNNNNNESLLLPFENTVELAVDSQNPTEDFKESIVEMVEAHGVDNWEALEKLLSWYLEVNEERNHEFIIDAFYDLFVSNLDSPDSSPLSIDSFTSLDSSWSTARVSSYSSPL